MENIDISKFNRIDLEKIEQEALIEAANLVAQNPHIDFNIQKELLYKEKLEMYIKKKQKEIFFQYELEKIQKEIDEEISKWEEEDRLKEEERAEKISSILSRVKDKKILQMVQKEIANREEQIKNEPKSNFISLVTLINMQEQSEEDVKRIYTVMPEDFEKLSQRRKEMYDKLEIKVEKIVVDEKQSESESMTVDPIDIGKIEKVDKIDNVDKNQEASRKKYESCVKKYEETFYYQGETSKSKFGNIIKAKDIVKKDFREGLKFAIDHQKALEEAERKKEEKKKESRLTGKIIGM